ncbi:MAG: hypothetical protein ACREPV_12300 [Lysobacter sp.]
MHLTARLTVLILSCLLGLAGCTNSSPAANALDESQYAWSGAIRWGDFGGALNLVDPERRETDPLTDLERKRYEQIKISSYRDVGANRNIKAGTAVRSIEIGVINQHTMEQRQVRYQEVWRWDEEGKVWWNTSGLPDLWAGQ